MNCGGLWSQNMCPALHQENDGLNDSVTVIKKHQHHVIKLAFKHTSSSRQLPGGGGVSWPCDRTSAPIFTNEGIFKSPSLNLYEYGC